MNENDALANRQSAATTGPAQRARARFPAHGPSIRMLRAVAQQDGGGGGDGGGEGEPDEQDGGEAE